MVLSKQNIFVLGATGECGLTFLHHILSLPPTTAPRLTLYARSPSKLPAPLLTTPPPNIKIIRGSLTDIPHLTTSMASCTTVVSFLGAPPNFPNIFMRDKRTPIADALAGVFEAMRKNGVKRILALSTPAFAVPGEREAMGWGWWLWSCIPPLIVPQGSAEMKAIGETVSKQADLEWTVFRVPQLLNGGEEKGIKAGFLGPKYEGWIWLGRVSLVRWVLGEIEKGNGSGGHRWCRIERGKRAGGNKLGEGGGNVSRGKGVRKGIEKRG
ncbi:hypothetical protein M501DRAFT_1045406 [Patellaria atrata CBS 101060]|uniref:NAD(P)-binding domain-containing protein n=1 Tax=Patellaria atrata CBS 101060 TaxID=1346257 RepID=A0A9P4VKL9_9PEZI|nr:hypothetical protein M501DRAFT_1045406 [Patellaria atrata CBS 101060]